MLEYKSELIGKRLYDLENLGYSTLIEYTKNYIGPGSRTFLLGNTINSSFEWVRTPQGQDFWSNVSAGEFERARNCKPEWAYLLLNDSDLVPKNTTYKVVSSGLLK